jgi:hypothetical protein
MTRLVGALHRGSVAPTAHIPVKPGFHKKGGEGGLGEDSLSHLDQLASILGTPGDPGQATLVAERLVARLQRLDEALPRYQKMSSQLFDLLQVHALDDIVPTVHQLLVSLSQLN